MRRVPRSEGTHYQPGVCLRIKGNVETIQAGTGLLGTNTTIVSTSSQDARRRKWQLQDISGRLLPGWRVEWCGKRMVGKQVRLMHSQEHQKAFYKGVSTCGSVWTCPVCASRISEGRRVELQKAVDRKGFTKVLVTFTLQHERSDSLAQLVAALNDSIRRLKQGRWWLSVKAKWGVVAYVTASEFTYGNAAGWHPHKHMLLFLDIPEGEIDTERLQEHITARYKTLLERHGRYASEFYGVDVRLGDEGAGDYVSKWGAVEEVTKSTVKSGREGGWTPFQLLQLYNEGNSQAGALFVEYAEATKGKNQLNWAKGARQVLELGAETSDTELAEQEEDVEQAQLLVALDVWQWKELVRRKLRLQLLEVADSGNVAQVLNFLDSIGVMRRQAPAAPG
jgi:hypothetical protein